MTSFAALAAPDDHLVGALADEVATRLEVGHDPLRARRSGRGRRSASPVSVTRASSSRIVDHRQAVALPVS